jgi:hypothetical protein
MGPEIFLTVFLLNTPRAFISSDAIFQASAS